VGSEALAVALSRTSGRAIFARSIPEAFHGRRVAEVYDFAAATQAWAGCGQWLV